MSEVYYKNTTTAKLKSEENSSSQHRKHKKKRKHKYHNSSSDSESNCDRKKDAKKRKKKHKRTKDSKKPKELQSDVEESVCFDVPIPEGINNKETVDITVDKRMAPMTKEEWDKRQSVVRRVYDESSGRHRLIKGDGEVIESIVSRDRHVEINKQATKGDGEYFQKKFKKM